MKPRARGYSKIPAGFDYDTAMREIYWRVKNFKRIANLLGFSSAASVINIMRHGAIPSHPEGERIWIMYVDLFDKKPPMTRGQDAAMKDGTLKRQLTE
jgi:hypothetical protein